MKPYGDWTDDGKVHMTRDGKSWTDIDKGPPQVHCSR